jgi:hypothetical protein
MPKLQQSWVQNNHPPTQWNLRGRQMKQCWIKYVKSIKKIPSLNTFSTEVTEFMQKVQEWKDLDLGFARE